MKTMKFHMMELLEEHFRQYVHAHRFAVGLHGTQKFYPTVKYKPYQILGRARGSLPNF